LPLPFGESGSGSAGGEKGRKARRGEILAQSDPPPVDLSVGDVRS